MAKRTNTADETWRDNFKSNLTSVSFKLTLSRPMLEYLCATADDVFWDRFTYGSSIVFPDNFMATEQALTRRGLIRRKGPQSIPADNREANIMKWKPHCELTPAGKAVVELLKVGGMFLPAAAAIQKMKARPGSW